MHQPLDLPMRPLVLADPALRSAVDAIFRVNGMTPQATVAHPAEILTYAWNVPVDLVVIESRPPHAQAVMICAQLHKIFPFPLLLIAYDLDEPQRIAILDAGADDVVLFPSGLAEIPARCRMLARRRRRQLARDPASAYIRAGDLRLDIVGHRLLLPQHQRVLLTPQQTRLLAVLLSTPGTCVSLAALSEHVFGPQLQHAQQRLGVVFRDLNRRLQPYSPYAPKIVSMRQHGYRLIMPLVPTE